MRAVQMPETRGRIRARNSPFWFGCITTVSCLARAPSSLRTFEIERASSVGNRESGLESREFIRVNATDNVADFRFRTHQCHRRSRHGGAPDEWFARRCQSNHKLERIAYPRMRKEPLGFYFPTPGGSFVLSSLCANITCNQVRPIALLRSTPSK